jgi:hypothetical protein
MAITQEECAMAHVTFIHGIANKPPPDELLRIWRRALADSSDALPLGDLGVTSRMVYWADVLYAAPDADAAAHEGVLENSPEAIDGGGDAEVPLPATVEERIFLEGLRDRLTDLSDAEIEAVAAPEPTGEAPLGLERVPLPWFLKKRFMAAFLRDVHHYLFDVGFSPRPGEQYRVQQEIRRRFVDVLGDSGVTRPHVVVSHSMGTVIAYDCLKRVAECPPVDGFMTLGSPLGLDEIQDQLQPGWSRRDGYPHETILGGWANAYDRLDPVCGFDARLANDFRQAGDRVINDRRVSNDGKWRHSIGKYLRQSSVRVQLRRLLDLP